MRSAIVEGLKDAVRHARRANGKCERCGEPAKIRGDRPGDHEMGDRYYRYCIGQDCKRYPLAKRKR